MRLQADAAQQGAAHLGAAQQGAVKTVCGYNWVQLEVGATKNWLRLKLDAASFGCG